MITIQTRDSEQGYLVPAGGEVLYYGTISALSDKWEIDTNTDGKFVKAANINGASNTVEGSASHTHTVPDAEPVGDHTHTTQTGNVSNSTSTTSIYPTANYRNASQPHNHMGQSGTSGTGGGHSHTILDTNSTIVYPPYRRLFWIRALEDASLPIGGIVMWDDEIANIADGFSLCDGNGTTPDMRDKFIMGENPLNNPGATGGSETHTHSNPNTETSGAHTHSISANLGGPSATAKEASGYDMGIVTASSTHSHGGSATSLTDSAHNHTLGNTGSSSHLPLYIQLYFIMRVA